MAKPSSALMGLRAPESALPRCQGSNGVCIAYARVKPEKVGESTSSGGVPCIGERWAEPYSFWRSLSSPAS